MITSSPLHLHIYIGLYLFRKTANINSKNFSVYEAVNGVSHSYKTANIFFDLSLYHGIQAGINVGLRGTITRQFYFMLEPTSHETQHSILFYYSARILSCKSLLVDSTYIIRTSTETCAKTN